MKILDYYQVICEEKAFEGDEFLVGVVLEDKKILYYRTTKDNKDKVEKMFEYVMKEDNQLESLEKCLQAMGAHKEGKDGN